MPPPNPNHHAHRFKIPIKRKHHRSQGIANISLLRSFALLLILIWGIYLFHIPREQLHNQVMTTASTIRGGNNTSSMPNNDCLVQLGHVRDIKLYSQNDEDGALLQLLRCMGGHGTKEYFEFGTESGVEINTRILRELYGWHGHLLDGGYDIPDINLHKEYFTPSNIVSLMQKYKVSKKVDVLSIDTDYDDLYIMREILLAGYIPRILIAEYNCNLGSEWAVSTVAKPVGKEQDVQWTFDCYFGASASALIKLAGVFGYTPVWSNYANLMFVRLDHANELNMIIPSVLNFPGPYTKELHHDCNMKTWKLIDDKNIAKATDKTISHMDFASSFADITLSTKKYENKERSELVWRVFHQVK